MGPTASLRALQKIRLLSLPAIEQRIFSPHAGSLFTMLSNLGPCDLRLSACLPAYPTTLYIFMHIHSVNKG